MYHIVQAAAERIQRDDPTGEKIKALLEAITDLTQMGLFDHMLEELKDHMVLCIEAGTMSSTQQEIRGGLLLTKSFIRLCETGVAPARKPSSVESNSETNLG